MKKEMMNHIQRENIKKNLVIKIGLLKYADYHWNAFTKAASTLNNLEGSVKYLEEIRSCSVSILSLSKKLKEDTLLLIERKKELNDK